MLTEVILDGAMGRRFGRRWSLNISKPSDALKLIDVNRPGLFVWIRDNLHKYANYKVVCEYEDGRKEYLDENTYIIETATVKSIRFTPLIEGAGKFGTIIAGVVLIIIGALLLWTGGVGAYIAAAGVAMVVGGVVQLIATLIMEDGSDNNNSNGKGNKYFDGPVNTTAQGVPVPLIYGEVLTGSHPISVDLRLDENWTPAQSILPSEGN